MQTPKIKDRSQGSGENGLVVSGSVHGIGSPSPAIPLPGIVDETGKVVSVSDGHQGQLGKTQSTGYVKNSRKGLKLGNEQSPATAASHTKPKDQVSQPRGVTYNPQELSINQPLGALYNSGRGLIHTGPAISNPGQGLSRKGSIA